MNIVIVTSSYPRFEGDGTAPFIRSICENLVKNGHIVEVIVPYDVLTRPMDTHGVNLHRFKYIWPERWHLMGHARSLIGDVHLPLFAFFLLPFYIVGQITSLMSVTRHHKVDMIYAHWIIPNGLAAVIAASLRRLPLVINLHGSDMFVANRNFIFRLLTRIIFHYPQAVIACSPELVETAIKCGSSREKTLLLPWGADPEIFKPVSQKLVVRNQFGLNNNELVISALGRMVYKKGFSNLVSAFKRIHEVIPDTRLVFGGEGPVKMELQEQVNALNLEDSVDFLGRITWNDVPGFLAASDIFALPSIKDKSGNIDGLPTVLLEAMSSGIAVIASDIGGISLAISNGINGLLVQPNSIDSLTEGLLLLCKNKEKRDSFGISARNTIMEDLNWANVTKHIEVILKQAIWQKSLNLRLGTLYRHDMLALIDQQIPKGNVLDVGSHDGYLLSKLKNNLRVGVDINPLPGPPGVHMVQADACFLPFKPGSFDQVYAIEVIEHVENDEAFARSLSAMVSPGGRLFLTTPSLYYRLYPPFLTKWISRKWGHIYRLGYTAEHLKDLFNPDLQVRIGEWNAPLLRLLYLPLRLLKGFSLSLLMQLTKGVARWDARQRTGNNGYFYLEAIHPIPGE